MCVLKSQIFGRKKETKKLAHKRKRKKERKTRTGPGSLICLSGQDQGIILEEGRIIGKYSRKTKTIFVTVIKIFLRD